jgi:hypothetical protein
VTQDISPFDRPRRRPAVRRPGPGRGGVLALLAVLALALATWSLGNSHGVVPPVEPSRSSSSPAGSDGG